MPKKINEKKKINIKLESGQTYLVTTIDEMLVISNALSNYLSVVKDEKERLNILHIKEEAVKSINENQFISKQNNNDDDSW